MKFKHPPKKLTKAFGKNELGMADYPARFSNIQFSRLLNSEARGGCTFCFPHGPETDNATGYKRQRNWKKHRKTQWRSQ